MDIRFAPMEGLTDPVLRRVHHHCFGGVDSYYIPFISPTVHHILTPREARTVQIDPSYHAVPQIMTHNTDDFLWASNVLRDMGYDEVNLNVGCPAGTVTAKVKGSGLLREPDVLRTLLDGICSKSPLPVSIKTRVGYASVDEWASLLEMYAQYPLKELIIHPRTRVEFYKGDVHMDCFDAASCRNLPLCYNGNIFTAEDYLEIQQQYPHMPVMIGRGLLANPALARQIKGGASLTVGELRTFHDQLQLEYSALYPRDQVHMKMRGLMKYVACCFSDARKSYKALCKSNPHTYNDAITRLFDCPLAEKPGYFHDPLNTN